MTEKEYLTSIILMKDPALISLIDRFIGRLPEMSKKINQAFLADEHEEFSNLIHQIKGVGGNYGYPSLTELCQQIEQFIVANNKEKIALLIEPFNIMVEKIIAGQEGNHKIVEMAN